MNKRPMCQVCNRAQVACLCHTIKQIENQLSLVILQHPSEVNHARGTAKIVELSLNRCQILVGEDFSQDAHFNDLFATEDKVSKLLLLYPNDDAISPSKFSAKLSHAKQDSLSDYTVIVLDGSWKKAYKMFCLNPRLAAIPCIGIDASNESNYRIRKSSRRDSLSTLEACHALLTQLEGQHFDTLLTSFDAMIEFQLQAMPKDVRQRYRSGQ